MWHFISESISDATNELFICQRQQKASGGDTHQCTIISDETKRYFVKTCPLSDASPRPLASEAEGLRAIEATQEIVVPHVICVGVTVHEGHDVEYLVLNHLRLSQTEQNDWALMGQHLAHLHRHSLEHFGWEKDNYIGGNIQRNAATHNWSRFFAEQRIGVQLEYLAKQGVKIRNIDRIVAGVAAQLANHTPPPALVHGDLWSGNCGFHRNLPVIYDPAVHYADRETDIAMTELFGAFPEPFYVGYQAAWPLPDGYLERKPLYQLYHQLNHAVLFGEPYLSQVKSDIIRYQ